jgi:hypothetical protein
MILTDILTIQEPPTWEPDPRHQHLYKRSESLLRITGVLPELQRYATGTGDRQAVDRMASLLQNDLDQNRSALYREVGTLPSTLLQDRDPWSLAAQCPRVELAQLRQLADQLNFLLLPFPYLDPAAYQDAPPLEKRTIQAFAAQLPNYYVPYVLCPVGFYSLRAHIQAKGDRPIYAGLANQQAFLALSMALPAFRSLHDMLEHLQTRVKDLEERQRRMEQDVEGMKSRILQLERYAQQELQERVAREARAPQLTAQIRALEARDIYAQDPLLVGIPRSADLHTDTPTPCLVGPCWGADFDDLVFSVLGLHQVPGQRTKLAERAAMWRLN